MPTSGTYVGKELYVDGTKVAANAGKESLKPRKASEAHVSNLFGTQTEEPGDEQEPQKAPEEPSPDADEELAAPITLPTSLPSEEYEALVQRNAARHDWTSARGSAGSPREQSRVSTHR